MYRMCTFSTELILFIKNTDFFWHTQPSAERIKSIQRINQTRMSAHMRGHRSFGSVLFTIFASVFDQWFSAALQCYLVNSESQNPVQCNPVQWWALCLSPPIEMATLTWVCLSVADLSRPLYRPMSRADRVVSYIQKDTFTVHTWGTVPSAHLSQTHRKTSHALPYRKHPVCAVAFVQ